MRARYTEQWPRVQSQLLAREIQLAIETYSLNRRLSRRRLGWRRWRSNAELGQQRDRRLLASLPVCCDSQRKGSPLCSHSFHTKLSQSSPLSSLNRAFSLLTSGPPNNLRSVGNFFSNLTCCCKVLVQEYLTAHSTPMTQLPSKSGGVQLASRETTRDSLVASGSVTDKSSHV